MEEKKKNKAIQWAEDHKKELAATGITICTVALGVIAAKNMGSIMSACNNMKISLGELGNITLPKTDVKMTAEGIKFAEQHSADIIKMPFNVQKHVRNLPKGYKVSAQKLETAIENGIKLMPNQTWVKGYTKGVS